MLKIELAELLRQPGKHIVVDVDDTPKSDDDVEYLGPVSGRIAVTNTGELVLVRGNVRATIRLECGRCLGEVWQAIDAEIEEQYTLGTIDGPSHREAQIGIVADDENEVPPGLMNGMVMDLGVVIRQAVILSSPLSAVCRVDCRGLCPVCRKNRNDPASGCRCEESRSNTPLAVLKSLYPSEPNAG